MAPRTSRLPDPMLPVPARVLHRRRELADTWTLELAADSGAEYAFEPGQFNMLYVVGVGEVPISISGDAADPSRQVHTVRAAGAVSRALAAQKSGAMVGLRGPFGSGWPMRAAEGCDVVLVAGGLGLAPLRPALCHLLRYRERYRRVSLFYGARGPREVLFQKDLARWRRRDDLEVAITVDHAGGDWPGQVGVVTDLIAASALDPDNTLAMVCGPELMMRFGVAALRERGMKDAAIYLSLERNMKCAVGHCGHCQLGPVLICRDGPVLSQARLGDLLNRKEL